MRGAIGAILAGSLLHAAGAMAGGYYEEAPGGRNVVWPPPGGVDRVQPPPPGYGPPGGPGYGGYGDSRPPRRYQPSYHYRGEFVPPPGPGWPGAAYARPAPAAAPEKEKPLEPGHPVQVIPPPGIPVDEVKQTISDKPQRGWRPVGGPAGMAAGAGETPGVLERKPVPPQQPPTAPAPAPE